MTAEQEPTMVPSDTQPAALASSKVLRPDIVGVHGGIRFDKTVNITTLVSVVSILGVLLGIWNTMDRRVTVLEEQIKVQRVIDNAQDYQRDAGHRELKETMTKVERQLERLGDSINSRRPGAPLHP